MIRSHRTEMAKIGDIRFDQKTGRRKRYNGVQWHILCRVDNCPLASTFNDLCARHRCDGLHQIPKLNERKISSIESKTSSKKSFSDRSRLSHELPTRINSQIKKISTKKRRRTSNQIENIFQRIDRQMKTLNERVHQLVQIRNLFLNV